MIFKAERCDPSKDGNCASETEIEEFLKGFSIDHWLVQQEMDY